MAKKLFSDDDFDKIIGIGDELIFDKPELTKLRVDLTWTGKVDLDICAFLLGSDGMMHEKTDLVYFNSKLRWKTKKEFTDPAFDPLVGSFSEWPAEEFKNPRKWLEATLPISADGSVIGSWDDPGGDNEDEDDEETEHGEVMHVLLDEVDIRKHSSIVFAAVVAKKDVEEGKTFANAHNPVVSIYNVDSDDVVAEYKLDKSFPGKDAVCFGRMEYNSDTMMWNFVPMDDSYNGGMQYLATEVFN